VSRILLGVTGSVAAVKTPNLIRILRLAGHQVKVAPTRAALTFFDPTELGSDPGSAADSGPLWVRGQHTVYLDADEWPSGRLFQVGEPVLHIELRRWADLLLIAPLDANTLAKLAMGLCDNLLTCAARAWDVRAPLVLAPAMNTLMWEHPATRRSLLQVAEDHGVSTTNDAPLEGLCERINAASTGLRVVPPQSKRLACGDVGIGAMADVLEIARHVEGALFAG
jgi:phosphopantothenoylcysteine decarboxylase